MELEQIIKRLDWLDEEHRKDKAAIDALKDQLTNTENELKSASKRIKNLDTKLSRFSSLSARVDQFDEILTQQRAETTKYTDALDTKYLSRLQDVDKRFQLQFDNLNKSINEIRKLGASILETKSGLKGLTEENDRFNKMLMGVSGQIEAFDKAFKEMQHAQATVDETRRSDSKRLADLQGEIRAVRKHMDEVRAKNDVFTDSIRRIDTRLNEILASEAERRQTQASFIEKQTLIQVEQDRHSSELEERMASLKQQSETMDNYLEEWDTTRRSLKRAQESFEEIATKTERRMNEITEMQRLTEDRFRQEWVAFKSDDQKRWASYRIAQDETLKDVRVGADKLAARLNAVEDLSQNQQDILQQTKEANEQLLQGLLAQIHELLTAYERIMNAK